MKENPELIGRKYSEDEKINVNETLKKWGEEASKPVEGELEKTQEEIKMIETINSIIQAELESLGIEGYESIPLEQIHFFPGRVFEEKFPDFKGIAFYISTSDIVYVNKDKTDTKERVFLVLLHELIHRASAKKFYADNDGGIHDARVGYRIRSPWKSPDRQNRLRGFNELMVDYTTYKILLKNQKLLERGIGITKEEIQGSIYTYMHYGPILASIIKKVSSDKGESAAKVFEDLERGQFQNSILALKDIERSFGKGALDVLSLLEVLEREEDNEKLEEMIKNFFAEEDISERSTIRSKIYTFVDNLGI